MKKMNGLDITVLGADGHMEVCVTIDEDSHWRLMELADKTGLFVRMIDYYDDAEFAVTELNNFMSEAVSLRERCGNDDTLQTYLDDIIEVAKFAKSTNRPLRAIAD